MEQTKAGTQVEQMRAVLEAVKDAVAVAGPDGVSGGTLYASLMASGCTFTTFGAIMGALVKIGKVKKRGHFYFAP